MSPVLATLTSRRDEICTSRHNDGFRCSITLVFTSNIWQSGLNTVRWPWGAATITLRMVRPQTLKCVQKHQPGPTPAHQRTCSFGHYMCLFHEFGMSMPMHDSVSGCSFLHAAVYPAASQTFRSYHSYTLEPACTGKPNKSYVIGLISLDDRFVSGAQSHNMCANV